MRQVLTNFTKGEFAPELYGRVDNEQYRAAAKYISNFIIQKTGGLSFRPGFRFVMEADDVETPVRYVPFQYNIEQAYVLVFADQTMRALALGGAILQENLKITAITKAANAQLTVPYHAYTVGTRLYLFGITGMTELNGQFATVVSVIDDANFTIDIDTTSYSTFVSADGTERTGAPAPPPPPPAALPPAPPPPPPAPIGSGSGGAGGTWEETDYTYEEP